MTRGTLTRLSMIGLLLMFSVAASAQTRTGPVAGIDSKRPVAGINASRRSGAFYCCRRMNAFPERKSVIQSLPILSTIALVMSNMASPYCPLT